MGESLYNPMLPGIVADLKAKGLAVESEGATVVFLDEYKNKEGEPMGVIIQKKDGGYLYTTTDIACAKYRYETLHADRVLYYIDSRQHQHLMQAWTIVRKAGYVPDSVPLEHHMFGMMLGKDGKPFKTRAGGTVKLADLLDEALERARRLVAEKNPDMPADELEKLANAVGIGAVKYADCLKTAPPTTSLTGTTCWPLRAIPRLICSMPIPACSPCSAKRISMKARWRRRRWSSPKSAKPSWRPVCCSLKKP
jgi:arginyl-tRNA synthetase